VHWSFGRAVGRAAAGAFLLAMFQFFWILVTNDWLFNDEQALNDATTAFSEMGALTTLAAGVIVAAIEFGVPALRLPTGAFWRSIGGNRWLAAAILGVAASLTIVLLIEYVYMTAKFEATLGLGWEIPVCGILGFLCAEAVFGRSGQTEG
jgi:hypothetical protein